MADVFIKYVILLKFSSTQSLKNSNFLNHEISHQGRFRDFFIFSVVCLWFYITLLMFYFNHQRFHRIYTNIFTCTPTSVERRCAVILRRMCQPTLTSIVFQVSRVFDLNYQVKPQPTFSLLNFLLFYTFGFNDIRTHLHILHPFICIPLFLITESRCCIIPYPASF